MNELKELARFRENIKKCISCGLCLLNCPVYAEERDENYVPRGRNRIISQAIDNPDDLVAGVKDRFSKCLLCRRCTMVCPQGVRTDLLTVAARADLVSKGRIPLSKLILFRKLLKDRNVMRKALRSASKFQRLLPVSDEKNVNLKGNSFQATGVVRHIPHLLIGLGAGRHLPSIANVFLSDQIQEINPPPITVARKNMRVAFFAGCMTEFCYPEEGQSLIKVLNNIGVEVVYPKNQACCGLPALASGDIDTAREIAHQNLNIFLELNVDFIVTGCASCGSTLKEGYAMHVARDEKEKALFMGFGQYVRDISELLVDMADFESCRLGSRLPSGTRVTYHDPCHLARYQGIAEQPRRILRKAFGKKFIEMDNNGCCGLGGLFSLDHYDLSKKIARKKVESIERTGADVVITSCPGCKMQLIDSLRRHGLYQMVVDISEVIVPIPVMDSTAFTSLRTKIGI